MTVRAASAATMAAFALNGLVFATWASRIPTTRDLLSLSPAQMGVVLLVGAAGSALALPLAGGLIERIGTKAAVLGAAVVNAVFFIAAALAVEAGLVAATAALLFVSFASVAAWDVSMNLQGTVVERALGRTRMPVYHACFSLGTIAGAGGGALAERLGVSLVGSLAVVCALAVGTLAVAVRSFLPVEDSNASTGTTGDGPARDGRISALAAWAEPRTLLIGVVVLAAALTEGAANDWVALGVVDGFGTRNETGALVFAVFVTAMTVMRVLGVRLLDRFGRVAVLRLCTALAIVGLAIFAFVPSLPLAVVGVILWGCGAALGFPVGMSAASDDPLKAARRLSVVSTIGYLAFLAGPPLLGLLAEHVGYRHAMAAVLVPLAVSLLLLPVMRPPGERSGAGNVGERGDRLGA